MNDVLDDLVTGHVDVRPLHERAALMSRATQ